MKPSCDKHPKTAAERGGSRGRARARAAGTADRDVRGARATRAGPSSSGAATAEDTAGARRASREAIFDKLKKSPWKLA